MAGTGGRAFRDVRDVGLVAASPSTVISVVFAVPNAGVCAVIRQFGTVDHPDFRWHRLRWSHSAHAGSLSSHCRCSETRDRHVDSGDGQRCRSNSRSHPTRPRASVPPVESVSVGPVTVPVPLAVVVTLPLNVTPLSAWTKQSGLNRLRCREEWNWRQKAPNDWPVPTAIENKTLPVPAVL